MNKKSTIIIPSYQNSSYLKLCIQSILKHSYFDHEIIVHLNSPDIESETFLNKEKYFSQSPIKILAYALLLIMRPQKVTQILFYMLMMICIFYLSGIFFCLMK